MALAPKLALLVLVGAVLLLPLPGASASTALHQPAAPVRATSEGTSSPLAAPARSLPGGPPPATWLNLTGLYSTGPGPRAFTSLAYDNAAQSAILYGGGSTHANGYEYLPADVWSYTPAGGWSNITAGTGSGVSERYGAMMAYDSVDGRLILMGGCDPYYCPAPYMWSYGPTAGSFTQYANAINGGGKPGGIMYGGFSNDPPAGGTLIFGGCSAINGNGDCTTFLGNTFTLSWPTTGTQTPVFTAISSVSAPSAREFFGMTWDPTLDGVVLFGGYNGARLDNDTWIFKGGAWQNLTNSAGPMPPNAGGSLVYDNNSGSLLLFGGIGPNGHPNDYTYSLGLNGKWVNRTLMVATYPSPRAFSASTSFPGPAFPLLYGGINTTNAWEGDTWVYGLAPMAHTNVSSVTTDVGLNVALGGWATGGLAPYSFTWNFGNGNSATSQWGNTTYTTPGTYTAHFYVTDTYGMSTSASVAITVDPLPTIAAAAQPSSTTTAVPVAFWGNASGGSSPLNYTWDFGDGSPSSYVADPSHLYLTPGSYTAHVVLTDAVGQTATASVAITVVLAPIVVQASRSPGGGVAPFSVHFLASASGGSGALTYSWTFGDGSAAVASASTSHIYTKLGTFQANVTVTDALSNTATESFWVWVYAPLSTSVAASPASVQRGNSSTISAATQGGNGSYTYAWTLNGTAIANTTSSFSWVTTGAGNLTFGVTVSDASGDWTTGQVVLNVTPPRLKVVPPPLSISIAANSTTSTVGGSVVLSPSASGGVPPYSYAWSINGSFATSSLGSYTYTFAHGGNYNFTLLLSDSTGSSVESNWVVVHVSYVGGSTTPPGKGSGGGGGLAFAPLLASEGLWVLLLVLLLVIVVVAAVLLRRRREPAAAVMGTGAADEGPLPEVGWHEPEGAAESAPDWVEPQPVSSPGPPVDEAAAAGAAVATGASAARPPHYVEFSRPPPRDGVAAETSDEEPITLEETGAEAAEGSSAPAEPEPSSPVEETPAAASPESTVAAPEPTPEPAAIAPEAPTTVAAEPETSEPVPPPEAAAPEPAPAPEPAAAPAPKKKMKLKKKSSPPS